MPQLGLDAMPAAQPELDELPEATAEPRRYGFHGTIKPPFWLREGRATGRGKRRYFDNRAGAAIGIIRLETHSASMDEAEALRLAPQPLVHVIEGISRADNQPLAVFSVVFPAGHFPALLAALADQTSGTVALSARRLTDQTRAETRLSAKRALGCRERRCDMRACGTRQDMVCQRSRCPD